MRAALGAAAILLVLAVAVILFVGLVPAGGRIAADSISSLISTPDQKIKLSRLQGVLSGRLRVDYITIADRQGTYGEIKDIAVDWSPLALLSATFHAERVAIRKVSLTRPPVETETPQTTTSSSGSSGFSLPVELKIDHFELPDIQLGQQLVGRDFSITAQGAVDATSQQVGLNFSAHRKDLPDAMAKADLVYAPEQNKLQLQASVAEPQGGLIARLLRLPAMPSVAMTLDGSGPLSNWTGQLSGNVDGAPVISVDGRHTLGDDGRHRLELTGGGQLQQVLPPALRSFFVGITAIDIAARFGKGDRIDIDKGNVSSGSIKLAASGALDPKGDNSLTASIAGANGPVAVELPLQGQQARLSIDNVNLTLTGAASSARLNATAAIRSADLPQGRFEQVRLQAESEDLDLVEGAGSVRSRLTIARSTFANADIDRVIRAPLTLDAPIRLAPPAIGLDAATFESTNLNGTVSGAYDQSKQAVTGNLRMTANPAALPPAIASKFTESIAAEGYINAVIGGRMSVENLTIKSGTIEGHGNVLIDDQKIDARLAGRLPDLGKFRPDAKGAAGYDIAATGPLSAMTVKGVVNSAEARFSGRLVEALSVSVDGVADPASPRGHVGASGRIDGKQTSAAADLAFADGRLSANALQVGVGPNKLSGALAFSPSFLPQGELNFQFPEIALLASLAGQQAQGDLSGTLRFDNAGEKPSVVVKASGNQIARGSLAIASPSVDMAVPDLRALSAEGTIRAARLGAGAQALTDVVLGVRKTGEATDFDLAAQFDAQPLSAAGAISADGQTTAVTIDHFTAKPRGIAVALSGPSRIDVIDGSANLSNLTLNAGNGRVVLNGRAGNDLDLTAKVTTLPASLANAFVPDIDAAGAITGSIEATGTAAAPVVRYDLQWNDAQLRQTRAAGLSPSRIDIGGQFQDNTLTLERAGVSNPDGLAITAAGRIGLGETGTGLQVTADIGSLPAKLANSFRAGLDAAGKVSGKINASGSLSAPAADFDIRWTDAATAQTRQAGLSAVELKVVGRYENDTVTLSEARLSGPQQVSLSAKGSVGLAGDQKLDLSGELNDIPASLANAFVPNLDAAGLLSGRLEAKGTIAAPNANFDLNLRDAAVRQTRAAGTGPLAVRAQGRMENNRVTLDALSGTGEGVDVAAKGWLDLAGDRPLDVDATITALPVSLANAFQPGLDARGSISGTLKATGSVAKPAAVFDLSGNGLEVDRAKTAGLTGLVARLKGRFENQALNLETADITGPQGLSLTARGTAALAGDKALDLTANLASVPVALANIVAPDLDAAGLINGSVTASGTTDAPTVRYDVNAGDVQTRQTRQAGLAGLQLKARGNLIGGVATLEETNISGGNGVSATLSGRVVLPNAQNPAPALDINADIAALPASLANGFVPNLDAGGIISGKVSSVGTPDLPAIRYDLRWNDLNLRQTRAAGLTAMQLSLAGTFDKGVANLESVKLAGSSGLSLDAKGSVSLMGDRPIDVTANVASIPASLAKSFLPGIETGGNITGSVTAGGTMAAPAVRYDLQWNGAEIRRQGSAGVTGMTFKAAGNFENNTLTLGETRLSGPQGMSLTAEGRVVLGGAKGPVIDVDADINALPASLANGFVPDLDAGGKITGKITALDNTASPGVAFNLAWDDAALKQTRSAGLAPFRITANGRFENNTVTVDTRLSGQSGLSLSGNGSVGLSGDRALNLKVSGGVPFALLASQLAGQGFVLEGNGNVDVSVGGTAAAPLVTGSATTSGARLIDVRRNLALENLTANIAFDRDKATISRATASLSTGGTVSAEGSVGINPAAGLPADLTVTLAKATYVDGQLLTATADGQLTVKGPLLTSAVLGGKISLSKTSITVPARLPSSLAELNIRQKNAPADVRRQMAQMQPKGGSGTTSSLGLDLVISAPSGIFVRGRGIDAELGGELTVTGTSAAPVVAGGFEMRRGRIIILTKRLDFTEGKITFGGGLIPVLDMEANTTSAQTTITVTVTGVANDPDIAFSSSPALPQDEVLARLVFGQSMSKLSPLQIAQLADAVSQLAGGGSSSLLDKLRSNLGVDDLDINTDSNGQTTVSVGRYLNDRTYLQLEQGGSAGARAVINLDVGRGVKLKAGAGGDGGSAGVFYEKEY